LPLLSVIDEIKEFYKKWEKENNYREKLEANIKLSKNVFIAYWILIISPNTFALIIQAIIYLLTKKYLLIVRIFIVFTDPDTIHGYLINSILYVILLPVIWFVIGSTQSISVHISFHSIAIVDIVQIKVDNLIKYLNDGDLKIIQKNSTKSTKHEWQLKKIEVTDKILQELIEEQRGYERYKKVYFKFMERMAFVEVYVNSFAIGIAIAIAFYVSTPLGMFLILIFIFQLSAHCIAGTVIEIQNQKFLEIVNNFPWIELSQKHKKIYLQFIHACQTTTPLVVPLIGCIDAEIFVSVLKAGLGFSSYLNKFDL
jgi:uncharacterized membrane protein